MNFTSLVDAFVWLLRVLAFMLVLLFIALLTGCGGTNISYEEPVKCTGTRENIVCDCVLQCITTKDQVTVTTNRNDCDPVCYER